jgi:hypothetical protein
MPDFTVKDSGQRSEFTTGMVRDVNDGKIKYDLVFDGPLMERYAAHMTAGAMKYQPRNWMKAATQEEFERFRESAIRHFFQYIRGDEDEDHFAATVFNLNGMAYVKERMCPKE